MDHLRVKRHEQLRRTAEFEPTKFFSLSRQSPVLRQLERFWACWPPNKVNLLFMSRTFFAEINYNSGNRVVLSNCVTQNDSWRNGEMFHGEAYSLKPELNSKIEEVGARLIPHVILGGTVLGRSAKIVISSTDTDVLMLLVHYFESLLDEAIEAFNLFGGGDKAR